MTDVTYRQESVHSELQKALAHSQNIYELLGNPRRACRPEPASYATRHYHYMGILVHKQKNKDVTSATHPQI